MRKTIKQIQAKKTNGEKITMLTAYDYPLASILDEAGIDIILVGDSLANVILGLESTRDVGMTEMIHHTKAVHRAVKRSLLVGDMPYRSYQIDTHKSVDNARRFIDEAGCDAVKIEWFDQCLDVAERIIRSGIPVMGHVGLTPQNAESLEGFKVQGQDAQAALKIIDHAIALEKSGCFSIVLECIPSPIAKIITQKLSIPTIGIGAGIHCDGQVLVTHDILGFDSRFKPKFIKQYINLSKAISETVALFRKEVEDGQFPDQYHSYAMDKKELENLNSEL